MHVQDHVATAGRAGQVQGGVAAASQLAERPRPADVERLGAPQVGEPGGAGGQRRVEVEGVCQVEVAVEVHGAVVTDLLEVHVEVPAVGGGEPSGLGTVGIEPDQGLLDQPVQLCKSDTVREGRDLPVDVRRPVGAQADGRAGDPPGAPRRQVAGPNPRPRPREAVRELDRLRQQRPAGIRGDPQGGCELGDAELPDLG